MCELFEAIWAVFQNQVPKGKPNTTTTTDTFDLDPTPDPTLTGKIPSTPSLRFWTELVFALKEHRSSHMLRIASSVKT